MKHEREDFVGEIFLIRKMIKKISGGMFRVFCHIGADFFGGYVSCMKKMKNTISWGVIYGKSRVCFIYEEMIKKISWGVFRGEIFFI